MDYRERVTKALSFNECFPVPVDVFEARIYPKLENNLSRKFKLKNTEHEGILKQLNSHFRWAKPLYNGPPLEEGNFSLKPAFPFKKITKGIWGTWEGVESYTGILERPLESAESISDINNYNWPKSGWFDYSTLTYTPEDCNETLPLYDWIKKHNQYLRVIGGWNPVFCRIMDLFGMDRGLLYIASRPNLILATIERIGNFLEDFYNKMAKATSNHFDILAFGDDFAGQSGMLLSPQKWKEYFSPIWKRLFAIGHKYNMKTMMHMCGAVYPVISSLIDCGLDIFEVVQVSAKGMDIRKLKKDFGKNLVFYGAIDVQQQLLHGNSQDVRKKVRETIDILGKNGGYILSSTHFLTDDIPVDNVIAMYNEANNYKG